MTRRSHDDVIFLCVCMDMIQLLRILQQLYMVSRRRTETSTVETRTKPYLINIDYD